MTRIGHTQRLAMMAGLTLGVLGGGWCAPALGQEAFVPPEVVVTDRNAAVLYYRVWLNMGPGLDETLDDEGEGYGVAEGARQVLEAEAGTVHALLKASRQSHADWEVEFEQGPYALLPSLGKIRYSSKLLAAHALRLRQR